jgi:HSP20 family molecular chaperone IbpA
MEQLAEWDLTDVGISEFADVSEELQRRGKELLRHRSQFHEHTVDDWIAAGRALARQPVIEVRRAGDVIELLADLVNVNPTTIEVRATADTITVTSRSHGLRRPKTFLSIHTPGPIVPASVRSEFSDGLLLVTADADLQSPSNTGGVLATNAR